MNIKDTVNKNATPKAKWQKFAVIGAVLVGLVLWQFTNVGDKASLNSNNILISKVRSGDLPVYVPGFGQLKAKHQRILTSSSQSTVEEIFIYPGAQVNEDTVVVRLTNPQMEQKVGQAKMELALARFKLRETRLQHKSEILDQEERLAELKAKLEASELKALAVKKLATVSVVSVLDVQEVELHVRQLKERVQLVTERMKNQSQIHNEGYEAQQELVKQMESNFKMQQKLFDELTVKAGIKGVLQSMTVKLGQSVTPGQELAQVGSSDALKAELKLPQRSASQIKMGNDVEINTFGGHANGKVIRIEPVVKDGRILVEVELEGELPSNARPDLTIDGKVLVTTLKNALYFEQPTGIEAQTSHAIYKVDADAQLARLTLVEFGAVSGRYIELKKGAYAGEQFITSDTSDLNKVDEISLQSN